MVTYFVYMLHGLPAVAHQALLHPLCGWQLVVLPAIAASLPDLVALLAALVPVVTRTDSLWKCKSLGQQYIGK